MNLLRRLYRWWCPEQKKETEWLIWVGDGMAPASPALLGCPVDIGGRKGTVIDVTALKILVEWD